MPVVDALAKTTPVSIRLTEEEIDVLDALTFILGLSNNRLLGPVVRDFLRKHEGVAGVQEAAKAKRLAREEGVSAAGIIGGVAQADDDVD